MGRAGRWWGSKWFGSLCGLVFFLLDQFSNSGRKSSLKFGKIGKLSGYKLM